jgi:hypothetical protein
VSALMFDNRNADPVWLGLSEIDGVRKSWHHRASNISGNHHPSARCCGNPQDLSFKFIDKFPAKAKGHARHSIRESLPTRAARQGDIRRSLPKPGHHLLVKNRLDLAQFHLLISFQCKSHDGGVIYLRGGYGWIFKTFPK